MPWRKSKFLLTLIRAFQGFLLPRSPLVPFPFLKRYPSSLLCYHHFLWWAFLTQRVFHMGALYPHQDFCSMSYSYIKPFSQWTFPTASLFHTDLFPPKPLATMSLYHIFLYLFLPSWIISQQYGSPKFLGCPLGGLCCRMQPTLN